MRWKAPTFCFTSPRLSCQRLWCWASMWWKSPTTMWTLGVELIATSNGGVRQRTRELPTDMVGVARVTLVWLVSYGFILFNFRFFFWAMLNCHELPISCSFSSLAPATIGRLLNCPGRWFHLFQVQPISQVFLKVKRLKRQLMILKPKNALQLVRCARWVERQEALGFQQRVPFENWYGKVWAHTHIYIYICTLIYIYIHMHKDILKTFISVFVMATKKLLRVVWKTEWVTRNWGDLQPFGLHLVPHISLPRPPLNCHRMVLRFCTSNVDWTWLTSEMCLFKTLCDIIYIYILCLFVYLFMYRFINIYIYWKHKYDMYIYIYTWLCLYVCVCVLVFA